MKLRVGSGDRFGTRRPLAERRLAGREYTGIDADDILEQARATIKAVARGRGGPHAVARAQSYGFRSPGSCPVYSVRRCSGGWCTSPKPRTLA